MKRSRVQFGRPRAKASSNEPFELSIEGLSHEGRGIGRHQGKTCFVSGALPGETVVARITERHPRYDEAECIELRQRAAQRAKPVCPHYGVCGGCNLQHLQHDQQIAAKQHLVLDQLQRLGKIKPEQVDSPLRSPPLHYRRSIRLGINQLQRDGTPLVGFRRRGSNKLVAINQCPVLVPAAEQLLQQLPGILSGGADIKMITHAEIIQGDQGGALTLRIKQRPAGALLEQLAGAARQLGFTLYLDNGRDVTPWAEDAELSYRLPAAGVELAFRPGDFLQVNAAVNEQMVERALAWLAPGRGDRVLDLFAGIGNFTLPLARLAGDVVGVEGSDEMVARAAQNARRNGLSNCRFYSADLGGDLQGQAWFGGGFSKILLDPPRSGALEAIRQLRAYPAERILYVSCNPAALARDAAELVAQGYRLSRFCVMDMFPQTAHVESLALFSKH